MRTRQLTLPAIALIAGTRAALGAGLGMLVSGQIDRRTRRGAGWALVAIGALTTVPIAIAILRRPRRPFWRA